MIPYHRWILLPIHVRNAIAFEFGIVKKGSTEVVNNTIKSDGYDINDIANALNMQALQAYLGTDMDDLSVLFDFLIQRMNEPIKPDIEEPTPEPAPEPVVEKKSVKKSTKNPVKKAIKKKK